MSKESKKFKKEKKAIKKAAKKAGKSGKDVKVDRTDPAIKTTPFSTSQGVEGHSQNPQSLAACIFVPEMFFSGMSLIFEINRDFPFQVALSFDDYNAPDPNCAGRPRAASVKHQMKACVNAPVFPGPRQISRSRYAEIRNTHQSWERGADHSVRGPHRRASFR